MSSIDPAALDHLRLRTCAIGLLEVPVEEYMKDLHAPRFSIYGTGFLIGPLLVLTNGHVVARIEQEREKRGLPKDRRHVAFLAPDKEGIAQAFHQFELTSRIVTGPLFETPGRIDFGLIKFKAEQADPIRERSPVTVCDPFDAMVGDPIAVYGYALGTDLLTGENDNVYRFGPILQQGYISAIAPYEHSATVERLLLDVRTSGGMSGSPVFDPGKGRVLGVHQAGIEHLVAFAIPLDARCIAEFVASGDEAREPGIKEGKLSPIIRGARYGAV